MSVVVRHDLAHHRSRFAPTLGREVIARRVRAGAFAVVAAVAAVATVLLLAAAAWGAGLVALVLLLVATTCFWAVLESPSDTRRTASA